jgi:SNF2 family DNA or RNA helicase
VTARPFFVIPAPTPPAVIRAEGDRRVKIDAAYGRLYVTGPSAPLLQRMPGAAWNEKRKAIELSLTLETLRGIRKVLSIESAVMARMCTQPVLSWAKAAGASEKVVNELHARLATGWQVELPWTDSRAGAQAPTTAPENQIEYTSPFERLPSWRYREPYEHQKLMATVGCSLDGAAFLGEMGTGKTRSACESVRHKFDTGELDVVFVTCPKGALNVWEQQFKWWAPDVQVVRLSSKVRDRANTILNLGLNAQAKRVVFLTNYDVVYLILDAIVAVMKQRRCGLVADEMHKLTNPEAQVTKAFMEASRCARWRCGMTGTPISNRVEGIWSEWYVIDLGITFGANVVQFKREFFNENSYTFKFEPKPDALDEIGLRMRRRGVRVLKKDCLDLPPKIYEIETVEMTREQSQAYKEMRDHLVAELEEGDIYATAATQLTAILRLTQITSGFVTNEEGGIFRFKPNKKLDALEEIVREHINDEQIIVWAVYRENVRAIAERLTEFNPVLVQGGQTDAERLHAETAFQSGSARLLVGNPAAGGVGLNLQAASMAVYYSLGYSLVDRLQSEDRCHRAGSEVHNKVTYIDMVCENTVDVVVRNAVAEKKEIAEIVVDLKRAIGVVT